MSKFISQQKKFVLLCLVAAWSFQILFCQTTSDEFTFVFMTDIHLQPENNAVLGFSQAIDSVNKQNPDFVITGGDLIMDALGKPYSRADSLYSLYINHVKKLNMPVYNTLGNHEMFGIYEESEVSSDHPEFGEKMFETRIGQSYYSFNHKGWHFIILNDVEDTEEGHYIGKVDSVQMEWLKADLENVKSTTPIVVSVHIPLITVATQMQKGSQEPNSSSIVAVNSKEVLDLFEDKNLKLVLQGHLHLIEDIYAEGIHFITGGAVCSKWWEGSHNGMEEGYVIVHVKNNDFDWSYFDYGWEVENELKN